MSPDYDIEAMKAAIRARGHLPNPYRMGREAGRLYAEAFKAYAKAARVSRDYTGRPAGAICPYTHPTSVRSWNAGFHDELPQPF